jgi:LCP family protein required for cell wall assembly
MRVESEPASGQYTHDVAVGNDKRRAFGCPGSGDHTIHTSSDIVSRFAVRAGLRPDGPVRHGFANLDCRDALVDPVVPFHQVGIDHGGLAEFEQLAGIACPLERARQHLVDLECLYEWGGGARLFAALVGQGNVGTARVAPVQAPFGLSVTNEGDLRGAGHDADTCRLGPGLHSASYQQRIVDDGGYTQNTAQRRGSLNCVAVVLCSVETPTPSPDDAAAAVPPDDPAATAPAVTETEAAVVAAAAAKAAVALPAKPVMNVHRADGAPPTPPAGPVTAAGGSDGTLGAMKIYSTETKKPRRSWPKVVGIVAGVLLLAGLAAGGYTYWYLQDTVTAITQTSDKQQQVAESGLAIALPNQPVTALVIGEDRRPGEGPGRSDTLMMVRIDPRTKSIAMMSFPRDLVVNVPGYGRRPINEAYQLGQEPLALATIKELTGIQINYLIPLDFRAFQRIVGTFGGVWLPVDRRYYNSNDGSAETNYMSINIQPGYQLVNGVNSLAFARYRHTDSDLVRLARQQTFVREFKKRVDRWGFASRIIELISIMRDNLKILGSNKKPADARTLLEYGRLIGSIPQGNTFQVRLDDISSSATNPGKLEASPKAVQTAVDQFLNPDMQSGQAIATRDVGKDAKAKVVKPTYDPAKIGVEVRNGNGTPAAAADAAWQLVENGWKAAHSAGDSLVEYLHTTVYFDGSTKGAKEAATAIAEAFGSDSDTKALDAASIAEMQQSGINIREPVVVVIGKTYTGDLAPPKVAVLPPKEEAQINRDPTRDIQMWRDTQRKAGIPLMMPTVLYAGVQTRDPLFTSQPPARVYKTGGHRAVYVTYSADSYDQVFGVQAIEWDAPPILDGPSATRDYKGRKLLLYFNGSSLQRVAWKQNGISYWLENSLTGRIPNSAMIAMAKSFRPVTR